LNTVYRAYRYPYDWVPQLEIPDESPIERIDVASFRVPGAPAPVRLHETEVVGTWHQQLDQDFCVFPDQSPDK